MAKPIYRDQGDTAPAITTQLLVNGSYFDLTSASVVGVVGGTIGSGAGAVYVRYTLPATWTNASYGSVMIALDPSAMAPATYPCASPGMLSFEIRAVSSGSTYNWPSGDAIPFIVRIKL